MGQTDRQKHFYQTGVLSLNMRNYQREELRVVEETQLNSKRPPMANRVKDKKNALFLNNKAGPFIELL